MDLGPALAAVRTAVTLLEGMRGARELAVAAAASGGSAVGRLRSAALWCDPLTAIAAVHALGACDDPLAGTVLADLLTDDRRYVAEHAVDALRLSSLVTDALPALTRACRDGGFTGMLAQRTLEEWAPAEPDRVRAALVEAMSNATDDAARARLVETLGLVPGRASTRL